MRETGEVIGCNCLQTVYELPAACLGSSAAAEAAEHEGAGDYWAQVRAMVASEVLGASKGRRGIYIAVGGLGGHGTHENTSFQIDRTPSARLPGTAWRPPGGVLDRFEKQVCFVFSPIPHASPTSATARSCGIPEVAGLSEVALPRDRAPAPIWKSSLADPTEMPPERLAAMDHDWSPCTDPRHRTSECQAGGKPCTRKGCSGFFKPGVPCLFCHAHPPAVLQRYEAFRGFARRAKDAKAGRGYGRR